MDHIRKGIHMKHISVNDIFSYAPELQKGNTEGENEQVTLGITNQLDDTRGNTVQFDLAYVKVDEQKV